MKHIERMRKVVNMAIKNYWLDRDPFQKFQPSFIKNNRQFLSADELAAIEEKEFKILKLQHAKDMFVFSCYTGLAYIDVYELTPKNLSLGIDGGYWINTTRHKLIFRFECLCCLLQWQSSKNTKTIHLNF